MDSMGLVNVNMNINTILCITRYSAVKFKLKILLKAWIALITL